MEEKLLLSIKGITDRFEKIINKHDIGNKILVNNFTQ